MVTPHWPGRQVGVGASLSDFTAFTSSDPHFQAAWGEINTQLDVEGAGATELNSAKLAFTNAFEQLSTQSFGLSGQDAINAAKQYVLVGQTVLGAVQTVGGLVNSLQNGAPPLEVMQAFTGTLIGLAAGAGLISAGVGAAIVAGVGAILEILGSVGLFGSPPSGVSVPGCNYSVPTQPDFQFGCIVAWGPKVEPTSIQWRKFPNPNSNADWAWFQPIPNTSTVYGDWPQGSPNPIRLGGPAPAGRPIDTAFPVYVRVGGDVGSSGNLELFHLAFFQAWQSNAEYALNGLKPQPDEQVLVHTLRLWNRAHNGPMVPLQGGSYAASLVPLAVNTLSGNDPLMFAGGLGINIGPIKSPPQKVISLHIPPGSIKASPTLPASTGVKVAATTAVVGGAATLGVVVFSLVKGKAVDAVLGHAWKTMKGWFR